LAVIIPVSSEELETLTDDEREQRYVEAGFSVTSARAHVYMLRHYDGEPFD
jgi:hypothetical protein